MALELWEARHHDSQVNGCVLRNFEKPYCNDLPFQWLGTLRNRSAVKVASALTGLAGLVHFLGRKLACSGIILAVTTILSHLVVFAKRFVHTAKQNRSDVVHRQKQQR